MRNNDKKPMTKKKKIILSVVVVLLVLVLAALIAGIIIYNRLLNNLNRFDNTGTTSPIDAIQSTEETAPPTTLDPYDFDTMFPGEEPIGGEVINIMLVGQDTRDVENRGLADTMILISVNPENKKLVMTSFIRDLYIDIVDTDWHSRERLNTAYCTGGIERLKSTLAYNFGVEVDNFVEVNFEVFTRIVDILGGVDIEMTKEEADYLNGEITLSRGEWSLQEGINHLTGEQALSFARIRAIDNDFNRTARQRYMITELLKLVQSLGIGDMINLAEELLPMVTTDMTNKEITKYIIQIAPMLKKLEIVSLRVPMDTTWTGKNVGTEEEPKYVIECFDLKANRDMIREAIGMKDETIE